jgi:hypothetical protein
MSAMPVMLQTPDGSKKDIRVRRPSSLTEEVLDILNNTDKANSTPQETKSAIDIDIKDKEEKKDHKITFSSNDILKHAEPSSIDRRLRQPTRPPVDKTSPALRYLHASVTFGFTFIVLTMTLVSLTHPTVLHHTVPIAFVACVSSFILSIYGHQDSHYLDGTNTPNGKRKSIVISSNPASTS